MLLNTAAELSHLPINIHGNRQPSSRLCHLMRFFLFFYYMVSDTSVCSGRDSTQLRLAPGNMSLMWIINVCVRGQGGYPTYTYLGSLFLEHGCWGTSHLKSEAKSTAKVRLLLWNDCGFYTFIILCVNVPSQAWKIVCWEK